MKQLKTNVRRRAGTIGVVTALLAATVVSAAFAANTNPHPALGSHALDGYVIDQTTDDPPRDWDDLFNTATTEEPTKKTLPAGVLSSDFTRDFLTNEAGTGYVNGDDTYFATGSKDTLGISPGWQCKHTNNATDKGDFANGYGYAANVPVAGEDHIIFFFGLEKDDDNGTNNLGFWLLQDGNVGCSQSGGGNEPFTGDHTDEDLLAVVSYDSGGRIGTAQGFLWDGDEADGGSLNTTPAFSTAAADCTGDGVSPTSKFCITTNAIGTRETPWWSPQKADKTTNAVLQENVFVEGFIDITNVFGDGDEPCFAKGLADTRASTSPTASLYDFLEISAPTCGPLVLKKYFDRDADGTRDLAQVGPPAVTAEPYLSGWTFDIFPNGQGPTGTPLMTVSTGADGSVTIPNFPFGDYDIYERGQTGYYNTDPATGEYAPGATPPTTTVKKDLLKTAGTQTVEFGNACFVDKTFNVNGAPAGATLALTYRVNDAATATTVNLTGAGTTKSYTLSDVLKPTDKIGWSYAYQSGGPSGSVTVVANDPAVSTDGESLADYTDTSGIGTACAKTNNTDFPLATLSGTKYKDVNANGAIDDPDGTDNDDVGIAGFDFKLWKESNGVAGLQKVVTPGTPDIPADTLIGGPASATSGTDGKYTFADVAPGDYYVDEDPESGWEQTLPASNGVRSVTVALAANPVTTPPSQRSVTILAFANAPLTNLQVKVSPQTGYSFGNITCTKGGTAVDGNGTATGTDIAGTASTPPDDDIWSANDLLVGRYICTVDIIDP